MFADRDKDKPDLEALLQDLQVTTYEQAQDILDRYIERKFQEEYRVYLTLNKWFPKASGLFGLPELSEKRVVQEGGQPS